ncbi:MAG: 4Fe-4S dicluster domain-containing protein [bacterium]|nr:4Fe-4S dicluster domain-containing protein [bacterium]
MARYSMAIDLKTCVGCAACVVACKVENKVDERFSRDRVVQRVSGEFPDLTLRITSERCNHCDDPPCVWNCPTGASHIADGGIVLVNENRCTGCKACVASCPYDARFISQQGFADKCTFCIHRVEGGLEPACVSTCPSRAMVFGDRDDPGSEISRTLAARQHKALKPATGVGPNVFYLE